jgi:hypothetical protein
MSTHTPQPVRRRLAATAAIAAAAAALAMASPATAQARAPALASHGPSARLSHVTGFRFAAPATSTSTQFGGWVFEPGAAGKSVTAEFTIPALTCTSATTGASPSVVMDTLGSAGQTDSVANVLQVCSGGKAHLTPALTVDGVETNGKQTARTGDLMKATVVTSPTKNTATIADLTKGHTFTLTKSGPGAAFIEEFIGTFAVDQGSTQLPVANFGTVSYSNGAIGGKAIGTRTPSAAVNMETSKNVLQILTGKITGSGKNAFTTTWKHS